MFELWFVRGRRPFRSGWVFGLSAQLYRGTVYNPGTPGIEVTHSTSKILNRWPQTAMYYLVPVHLPRAGWVVI